MSTPAHIELQAALVAELRSNASAGYDEWRVQDPKDGSYCVAYSWPDTMDPERDARDWLADHRARFPRGRYVDYVVASVRVVPKKDRLLAQAADSLEQVLAALDAEHAKCVALQAEVERITEAGRAHIRSAAAFEAQRDELLACLRGCVEYVDETELKHVAAYGEHHHAARLARVREDAKMARAAIARAEGGAA